MALGAAMNAKIQAGVNDIQETLFKEANSIASDAIVNHKTVSSFANESAIVERYRFKLKPIVKKSKLKAHLAGFFYGLSQFVQYAVYALMFWAGAEFIKNYDVSGEDVFIAMFVMMFGTFGAG